MDSARPIGYWLRHLDELLERQFSTTLADLGMERRHWQVLHALSEGAHTTGELRRSLEPFWAGDGPGLDDVVDGAGGLVARGWARTDGPERTLTLTDPGRAAHARTAERIHRIRATVLTGLSGEQYAETVRVLSVMAGNVERDLAAHRA